MKEKRILDLFSNIDETYIHEANPQYKHHNKFRIPSIAIAACLCIMIMAGIGASLFTKTEVEAKYYNTNIAEVSSMYNDVLLAEKISYEKALDTTVLLCYAGSDLPISVDNWKNLSVSADYDNYALTMNCAFNGETITTNEESIENIIQYGDTTIEIYQAEATPEYDVSYYAVFEYQNVWYKLHTYSNDENCIYEILQSILGTPNAEIDTIPDNGDVLPEILGFNDYYVRAEETTNGFVNRKYYTQIDGVEICIAEVFGYVVPGPEVYNKDLNGDGINELICNCIYGTGAERVYIYRNNNGVIERGHLSYDLWDTSLFPNISNQGSSYIHEKYIEETNTYEIKYPTDTGENSVVFENLDMFEFQEFIEEK